MKYHYIGSVDSDACPGLSQSWSIYIGRDKQGVFHLEYDSGDGFDLGNAEEACEWIKNNSGLFDSETAAENLEGKWGYSKLVKLLRG